MEENLKIDVAALDQVHRRALEEVIGRDLSANQRLIISISEVMPSRRDQARPAQSVDDWTKVYEALSDAEIEAIDRIAKTRADLTRNLP
jgi:hypothetical protein